MNYNQVGYGSSDTESVKKLQELLYQNGATLDVDGNFGTQTQQAVKDYQKANNLTVDGIAGSQTWSSLTKTQDDAAGLEPTAPEETAAPAFEYGEYQKSDAVAQAEALLQQQLSQKPGAYQSAWQTQLNDTLQKILNREEFSYDLNGDALYQQYKDQYTTQGKMAMMDAMGQAAAMTGGYGNSYAQSVGQQAYQGYLQQLNDRIPELYQLALDQYNRKGDEMYQQAALMAQMEDQDYGRYRDSLSDYYAELDRLAEDARYQGEKDYSRWADGRDFAYGQFADDRIFAYQQERDKIADQQWQAQFDEAKRQFDLQYNKSSGGYVVGGDPVIGDRQPLSGNDYRNYYRTVHEIAKNSGPEAAAKWVEEHQYEMSEEQANALLKDHCGYTAVSTPGAPAALTTPTPVVNSGFSGTTSQEAIAYIEARGKDATGIMTQSEWARHKNGNNSAGGEHEVDSYQDYLRIFVNGKLGLYD